jgi:hypothetical protein
MIPSEYVRIHFLWNLISVRLVPINLLKGAREVIVKASVVFGKALIDLILLP